MNKRKVSESEGKEVRLRPVPVRFSSAPESYLPLDSNWLVLKAGRHGVVIMLLGYENQLTLAADQVHDFRSDPSEKSAGFLNLNGQMYIRGAEAWVEPMIQKAI